MNMRLFDAGYVRRPGFCARREQKLVEPLDPSISSVVMHGLRRLWLEPSRRAQSVRRDRPIGDGRSEGDRLRTCRPGNPSSATSGHRVRDRRRRTGRCHLSTLHSARHLPRQSLRRRRRRSPSSSLRPDRRTAASAPQSWRRQAPSEPAFRPLTPPRSGEVDRRPAQRARLPVRRSKQAWCQGQRTVVPTKRPSANGPPRCGQVASNAKSSSCSRWSRMVFSPSRPVAVAP